MRSRSPRAVIEPRAIVVRHLGCVDYTTTLAQMQAFTSSRDDATLDEMWVLEHNAVFTLGQACKPEHVLAPSDIPVIRSDRGGQVTYHGPGQLVVYLLLDLRRLGIGARGLVTGIETSVITLLRDYHIGAEARREAPGVYVAGEKIAALGLRIRKGCSYHGLSLNVDLDLAPFSLINPCGYAGLKVTRLADLVVCDDMPGVGRRLVNHLANHFGYDALLTAR